jgi:hypothetical protein
MKRIKFIFFIIFLSLNINKIITQSQTQTANVYYSKVSNKYTVKYEPINKDSLAYAKYILSYEIEGWDHLYLSSSDQPESIYSDYTKHYGMGYLEGYITFKRLYDHYRNNNNYKFYKNNGIMPEYLENFFKANIEFMKKMGIKYGDTDPYFHEVYNYYNQMIGMLDGYNARVQEEKAKNISLELEKITLPHFMATISVGDIDELGYLNKTNRPNYKNMTSEQIKQYVTERMHCSSLIKVAPDFSDVWFGHSTWSGYNRLLKTFKEYRYYPGGRFPVKANTIMVSGYAGAINSNDDFYITSANLYVAETTNNVFNTSLFDNLTPESFMCWIRTMVALRLADNGKDWCQIFQRLNSGTYNNQFMILDLKLIDTDSKEISDGALYIIEQLPGYFGVEDVTVYLRRGYWPSYNTPFVMKVRELSGVLDIVKEKPDLYDSYDYDGCARANIFRRDQNNVTDIDSYRKLLRYNDFKNDPLSKKDPSNVIAYRGDLDTSHSCFGATDLKFTSINDIKTKGVKKVYLINGPTYEQQEVFDWSTTDCKESNPLRFTTYGQVNRYDFGVIEHIVELW